MADSPVIAKSGWLKVGLTGGVASGKSSVAEIFRQLGIPVIDTDEIARDIVSPDSEVFDQLIDEIGDEYVDDSGRLDRARLRADAFADDTMRRRIESVLHPHIRRELTRRSSIAGGPYQLHVIPLLAETGMAPAVDRVLVVDCPSETQLERLLERDPGPPETARKMIAAQATREERLALADDVICNDGTIAQLEDQAQRLHQQYLNLAGQ